MASICKEIMIDAPPEKVWDALRDYGALHQRLVPGFVVEAEMRGDVRVITFFNGSVAEEQLVGTDEGARRLAYTVIAGPLGATHTTHRRRSSPRPTGGADSSGSPTCPRTSSPLPWAGSWTAASP